MPEPSDSAAEPGEIEPGETEPTAAERAIEHETVVDDGSEAPPRASRWRMAALAVFFVGSFAIAKLTGLLDNVDVDAIRGFMESAGAWGFFAFVAAFALGELMHIPGMVFVGAAALAYGDVLGIAAAYAGAVASVITSFYVVRTIGGQPLAGAKRPWMKKILARLEHQPIRTVAVLRFLFWLSPALNYGLAMSSVRFREYLLGSALGLMIPIPLVVLAFDQIAQWAFFL